MNVRYLSIFLVWLSLVSVATVNAQTDANTCERLGSLSFAKGAVTTAQVVAAGKFSQPEGRTSPLAHDLPAFCRVAATLKPTKDSDIKMEIWLPIDNWNGRLQSVGNGGLAGSISYAAMMAALASGYATASTDTGHTGTMSTASWALGHPEKIIDYGHRAVHEMTVAAKVVVKNYYGRAQHHAYWNGCSEGGAQALSEVQRYPNDYDGIIAGAPANYIVHLQTNGAWIANAIYKDPATFISPKKLPAINQAVLEACDDIDGVKDGLLEDPRVCAFDVSRLKCNGAETDKCLTVPQITGIKKIYSGAKNPHTGETLFPGHALGSELEWNNWIVSAGRDANGEPTHLQHLIQNDFFKYIAFGNPKWDWRTLDFDTDIAKVDKALGKQLNHIDPDLNAFKAHGGKLLQYHGWYDPAISPINSINYFESVQRTIKDTGDFYRLFMIPGMAHCGGGPGASDFDKMNIIVKWVEEGKAPASIVASRSNGDKVMRTHRLCPYPQTARYNDSGNTNDAANFSCVDRNAR